MSSFKEHLFQLASPASGSSSGDSRDWRKLFSELDDAPLLGPASTKTVVPQWEQHQLPLGIVQHYAKDITVASATLTSPVITSSSPTTTLLVHRFMSKPHLRELALPLRQILLSESTDDAASTEVVELLGFGEIEIATDIMGVRQDMAVELEKYISEHEAQLAATSVMPPLPAREIKKGKPGNSDIDHGLVTFTEEEARRNMEANLVAAAARPLYTGISGPEAPQYPHVYTTSRSSGNVLSTMGTKFMLPLGTTREHEEEWEEVTIPPARTLPPSDDEKPVSVDQLDPLARGSFPGYKTLNRVQSIVYETAYTTNQNLLICAPTGAGKTDVAMLTILRVLGQYSMQVNKTSPAANITRDAFKIIYVAPLKALASEITRKLGRRLKWLNVIVKELTGDMQLTRAEIAETQIIVTTPEKWDVVTRKPTGEGELASKVKLLIIDEVHLLNEDRGAVIETIVARTLRQVESTQSLIRVVGLSATLPNYVDVAEFLRVSTEKGLFFFDSSFRPVPLEQHFIGVKGKPGSPASRKNLDRATFVKVLDLVRQGHQVMVFVHARKETVKTAQSLRESVLEEDAWDDFDPSSHPQFEQFRREIGTSRNKEMKQLFDSGFGIHHAGMLRSDRNMMERMFEARAINVLCCTATLAWGINLPAHAVIIKGTQIYDASKGSFVDLSVLDVLQIFGRAGRPGLEDSGVGYICTTEDKLDHYLSAVTASHPIESTFVGGIVDALNAEISLGTVATVEDGVVWIGYTYLFVRMKKNPYVYGITQDELSEDPTLRDRREALIKAAAGKLVNTQMITFVQKSGALSITDLGRIAAKYYIRHSSIEIFNDHLRPNMTEADVLRVLSMSSEFDQIQVRESELEELEFFLNDTDIVPCQVKNGTDTSQGKVNILLQGYISNAYVEDFTLVSDTTYAAQNGGRIARALLEIVMTRKLANPTAVLMAVSKAIEKRMWPFENPMKQFQLSRELLHNLGEYADELSPAELASMNVEDLGRLIHLNTKHGAALLAAARQFPSASVTYKLRPLSSELLRIDIQVIRMFEWNAKLHGNLEPFWLWVEDHAGENILQWAHLQFKPGTTVLDMEFIVQVRSPPPPSLTIRLLSDRWLGAEDEVFVPLGKLNMPSPSMTRTSALDIPFLPLPALHDPLLESLYEGQFRVFNGIQTQCFWAAHNSPQHILLSAPNSCGKSVVGQLAIWRAVINEPTKSCLVIMPHENDAKDFYSTIRVFSGPMQLHVNLHLSGGSKSPLPQNERSIDILTPRVLLAWLDGGQDRSYFSNLSLVLCERLELLDETYELSVSVLLHATQTYPVRFVGLSQSLNDAIDLARWLNVSDSDLYDFRPRDRDQPLSTTSQSFTIPLSPALFKAMVKPAYTVLRSLPASEASIIFVPSRGQCSTVCADLVTQCAIEMHTQGFLGDSSAENVETRLLPIHDHSLVDGLVHGIGVLHKGMLPEDQLLIMNLFADGVLRVLVVPRQMCWTLPVRASLVIAYGTQYLEVSSQDVKQDGNRKVGDHRTLRDYSVHELVRMQGLAVHHGREGRFHLLCHAEQRDTYLRFLEEGLPLESSLLSSSRRSTHTTMGSGSSEEKSNTDPARWEGSEVFRKWFERRRAAGSIRGKQDALDMLSHTFLRRRMKSNPTYYDVEDGDCDATLSRKVDLLFEVTAPSPSSEAKSASSRSIESKEPNPQSTKAKAST